jgi:hypothetical protein
LNRLLPRLSPRGSGRLRQPARLTPFGSLLFRIGVVAAMIGVALAGHLLARAAGGSNFADYIADLIVTEGSVQHFERAG